MCRNVQVARPSCSTSGGHPGGGSCGRTGVVDCVLEDVPPARAAIIVVTDDCAREPSARLLLLPSDSMLLDVRGFQLRNAVQILHGFPSGPNTIPGGSGDFFMSLLSVSSAAIERDRYSLLSRFLPHHVSTSAVIEYCCPRDAHHVRPEMLF